MFIRDTGSQFLIDENKSYFASDYYEYKDCNVVEIFYCPMCGKKLER